ncbi:MAG: TlpA family protein disulfide reductase [Saprospiraceae bacterium]|nr:TlpA family protein disulfide reductase [Saprospiraceae bacterium]
MQYLRLFTCALLSILSLTTSAQSDAAHIIHAVNHRIEGVQQGYYSIAGYWKAATKDDTLSNTGQVYFFRNSPINPDAIAPFILVKDGELREAFDGQRYYYISAANKHIGEQDPQHRGGIHKMIEGGYRSRWAFQPFLRQGNAAPFEVQKFAAARVDTFVQDGATYARITVLDSFENKHRLSASDPAMVAWTQVFEVSLGDFVLHRWVQTMLFWSKPQYQEIRLSAIENLPDGLSFERVFNKDSLLSAGYQLKTIVPTPKTEPHVSSIRIGDTIPSMTLQGLHGDTLQLGFPAEKGLLLLDFWYRGCGPCILAMPVLERIHQKYSNNGVRVCGLNGRDADFPGLEAFLRERTVTYPTFLDPHQAFTKQLNIKAFPTLLCIDRSSCKVLDIVVGHDPDLEARLGHLLQNARR